MNGINTTLCYLKRGEEYLMLHRVKKEGDLNKDKWIGIGGKFEAGERLSLPGGAGGDRPHPAQLAVPGDRHLCIGRVRHRVYAPL